MSIVLGGIDLGSDLLWPDKHQWSPVTQTVRRALDGGVVVYYAANVNGRPITLQSTQETGWVELQVVRRVESLASNPGEVYNLSIGEESFTVMFRHDDPPAFLAEPLIPRINPEPEDQCLVTIKLFTV